MLDFLPASNSASLSPLQCHLCKLPLYSASSQPHVSKSSIWCEHCLRYFDAKPRCQCCGLVTTQAVERCGQCLQAPPLWQRLYCIGDHCYPLSHYVTQLKYRRQIQFTQPLAALLSSRITQPAPLLTCVPLHWHRHCLRGFNQSNLLAKALLKQQPNSILYEPNLFRRTRSTSSQKDLSKTERNTNLRNAFELTRHPKASHIAIIDDVVTTGSTVQHLCKLLLAVGIKKIDIYCICRTPDLMR